MTRAATSADGPQADRFAKDMHRLLAGVLTVRTLPPMRAISTNGDRYIVQPIAKNRDPFDGPTPIPLKTGGDQVAQLIVSFALTMDSRGDYLAVESSKFHLLSTRSTDTLIRYEFVRQAGHTERPPPSAHWHVHAESGAASQLRTLAGIKGAHDLSSVHIPVGGPRYRVGLEDFLQMLVQEFGIDAKTNWRAAIDKARLKWRDTQAATAARDTPETAARVLRELGYTVKPPVAGHPDPNRDALVRF